MEIAKICFKCGEIKPLSAFYKHPQMPDGHVNKCKECNKRDVRENRAAKLDYYILYDRKRYDADPRRIAHFKKLGEARKNNPNKTEISRKRLAKYRERYPEKYAAHIAVYRAVRGGKLIPLPCEVCGSTKSEAHHDDYSKPLEVRWLCKTHHFSQNHKKSRTEV